MILGDHLLQAEQCGRDRVWLRLGTHTIDIPLGRGPLEFSEL